MNHLTDFQLNEYLDNAIDETMKHKFDSHLQSCAECLARLEELQLVFFELAELHEIELPGDLTPSIMEHLPQKQHRIWTPFFAAQLGAVLGVFLWFSEQAAKSIELVNFNFPQFKVPTFQFSMPTFRFPNFYSLFTILHSPSSILHFSTFNLQLVNLPTFQLSSFNLIFISAIIFILWLVGNLSLLCNRPGVQK